MRIAFGLVFLFGPKNGDLIWEWGKLLRRSVHCCAYAAPSPPLNVSDEDDCVYRILGTLQYFSQVPAELEALMVGYGDSRGAVARITLRNRDSHRMLITTGIVGSLGRRNCPLKMRTYIVSLREISADSRLEQYCCESGHIIT